MHAVSVAKCHVWSLGECLARVRETGERREGRKREREREPMRLVTCFLHRVLELRVNLSESICIWGSQRRWFNKLFLVSWERYTKKRNSQTPLSQPSESMGAKGPDLPSPVCGDGCSLKLSQRNINNNPLRIKRRKSENSLAMLAPEPIAMAAGLVAKLVASGLVTMAVASTCVLALAWVSV